MLAINDMLEKTILILTRALQYGYARQNIIAHNIANSNTPGYKALDLLFPENIESNEYNPPVVFKIGYTGVTNLDGNNVNIEMESLKSMYTTLYTQTILDFLRFKFDTIKAAIMERVA